MTKSAFGQLILKIRLQAGRLITPVQVAAALLWLVAAFAWIWGVPQLKQLHSDTTKQVSLLQTRLDHLPATANQEEKTQSRQYLQDFYAALGETHYAEQQVATVIALATKNGLTMGQTDYKLSENRNGNFRTYTVTIPIKGQYVMIRNFCDQMLLAIPFASLDELGFKRVAISSPIVETRVRFTLYLDDIDGNEGLTFRRLPGGAGAE